MAAMQEGGEGIRVPDGAEIVGQVGSMPRLWVSLPADDDGFIGMQCPSCRKIFRLHSDDYEGLPETIWCVYCGLSSRKGWFETPQQRDRFRTAVLDFGAQVALRIRNGLSPDGEILFGGRPYRPEPLPSIEEVSLIRVRNCVNCGLRYAVFGQHRFCPACGQLPALNIALGALDAATAGLDLAIRSEAESPTLCEQGVFDQIRADTLKNLINVVEAFARSAFRTAVRDADDRTRSKGNIFQRLDQTAVLFTEAGFADLQTHVGTATWQRLKAAWQLRHLLVHNDGLVDDDYLAKCPTSGAKLGQRLTVSDQECRRAIEDTRSLCSAIQALLTR